MTRSPIRLSVVLLALVLGLTLPGFAEETCEETDLFVANVASSQTQLLIWISNPTQEALDGRMTITAEYDETQVTFDVVFTVAPTSTVIVDITFPSPYMLIDAELCGGRPDAINEAPDPIVVRVR